MKAVVTMYKRIQNGFPDRPNGVFGSVGALSVIIDNQLSFHVSCDEGNSLIQHLHQRSLNSLVVDESFPQRAKLADLFSGDDGSNNAVLREQTLRIDGKEHLACNSRLPLLDDSLQGKDTFIIQSSEMYFCFFDFCEVQMERAAPSVWFG